MPLLHAVAASCAVPGVYPPVRIDGRRYVDGGMRSAANADLAQGYDRLVVLAPIPRGVGPMASVDAQVTGMVSRVAVVSPDAASRKAIGRNVLDPAAGRRRRGPVAPRPRRSRGRSPRSGPPEQLAAAAGRRGLGKVLYSATMSLDGYIAGPTATCPGSRRTGSQPGDRCPAAAASARCSSALAPSTVTT